MTPGVNMQHSPADVSFGMPAPSELAGQLAPDFTAPTDSADALSLSSLRGRFVVLYFYPKDDTPG